MNPYSFIIDDFKNWSFSRLSSFSRCPYEFYLSYIKKVDQSQNAFAQYGTFIHKLLEEYAKNELLIFELLDKYKEEFALNVTCDFPPNKYVNLNKTYFDGGNEYFSKFEGFDEYEILDVEKEVKFKIDKYPFIGYIDLIVKNKDGDIKIIDHKSKDLSQPQKKRWADVEKRRNSELYEYLRQLYIYAIPLIEQEGIIPKYLCFNCFRKKKFLKIQFDMVDYEESKQWALNTINNIYADKDMKKTYDSYYFCNYICGVRHFCPKSDKFLGVEL